MPANKRLDQVVSKLATPASDTEPEPSTSMESSSRSRRKPTVTHRIVEPEASASLTKIESEENGINIDEEHTLTRDEDGNLVLEDGTMVIQPEAVDENGTKSKKRSQDKREESLGNSILVCTACNKQVNPACTGAVKKHPVLKVLICKRCYIWYNSDEIDLDSNGIDEQCRWCGQGGNLLCCDFCHNAFCKGCIKRNLGRTHLSKIMDADEDDKWHCYVCNQKPLAKLIEDCDLVLEEVRNKKSNPPKKESTTSQKSTSSSSASSSSSSADFDITPDILIEVLDKCLDSSEAILTTLRSYCSELKKVQHGEDPAKLRETKLSLCARLKKTLGASTKWVGKVQSFCQASNKLGTKSGGKANAVKSSTSVAKGKVEKKNETGTGKNKRRMSSDEKEENDSKKVRRDTAQSSSSKKKVKKDVDEEEDIKDKEILVQKKSRPETSNGVPSKNEHNENEDGENEVKSKKSGKDSKEKKQNIKADGNGLSEKENGVETVSSKSDEVVDEENDDVSGYEYLSDNDGDNVDMKSGDNTADLKNDDSDSDDFKEKLKTTPRRTKSTRSNNRKRRSSAAKASDSDTPTPGTSLTKRNREDMEAQRNLHLEVMRDADYNSDDDESDSSESDSDDSSFDESDNVVTSDDDYDPKSGRHQLNEDRKLGTANKKKKEKSAQEIALMMKNRRRENLTTKKIRKRRKKSKKDGDENKKEKKKGEKKSKRSEKKKKTEKGEKEKTEKGEKKKIEKGEKEKTEKGEKKKTEKIEKEKTEKGEKKKIEKGEKEKTEKGEKEKTEKDSKKKEGGKGKKTARKKSGRKDDDSQGEHSESHDSDLDKEIALLSSMPKLKIKVKKLDVSDGKQKVDEEEDETKKENDKESDDQKKKEDDKAKIKTKKLRSRKDKKDIGDMLDELGSSDSDNDDEVDEEEEDEDDGKEKDLEKQMEEVIGELSMVAQKQQGKDADDDNNEEAERARLLMDDDSDDDDDDQDEEEDMETDGESDKKAKKSTNKKKKDDAEEKAEDEDDDSDASDSKMMMKKKSALTHNALLDAKLSESDGDVSPKKDKSSKKGKGKGKGSNKKIPLFSSDDEDNAEDDEQEDEEESSNSLFSDDASDDDDGDKKKKKSKKDSAKDIADDLLSSDSDFVTLKKGKKGWKKKAASTPPSSSESEEGKGKKKKGKKKRSRIKTVKSSSEEESGANSDDSGDIHDSAKKRKKIRKVIKDKKLGDKTREAARAEEDRRERIKERQEQFNQVIVDAESPDKCPMTTKLVLETKDDETVIEVLPSLIKQLKPHQVEAVKFVWGCIVESVERVQTEDGGGCILAHCMGLGKTLSMITVLHTLLCNTEITKQKHCLVVCPLNIVLNWCDEFEKWLDEEDQMEVYELSQVKTNALRADHLSSWHEGGGIMILSYEMYRNMANGRFLKNKKHKKIFTESLIDPGPDLVVCDEGHILKNDASAISKAMNRIRTRRRVVLTGTPLQNNLAEYHVMVDFVKPRLLGTRKEFLNRFVNPITNGQCLDSSKTDVKLMKRRAHILHETLAGCVQRRDYSALTKYLPPKYEYVISIRLSETQCKIYQQYLERAGQVEGNFSAKGGRLFSDYQSLMRIWTHPWIMKLDEIRQQNKPTWDDEDSFVDDDSYDSEDELSGGSNTSKSSDSDNGKKKGPCAGTSRGDDDSNSEDEVNKKWKSSTRRGENGEGRLNWRQRKEQAEEEEALEEEKAVSSNWWAEYLTPEDQYRAELGPKLLMVAEILRMAETIGDKVLIFSQSLLSLDILEDFLEHWDSMAQTDGDDTNIAGLQGWTIGADYFRMDGSTLPHIRKQWVGIFNEPDNHRSRLFLISTKAGGLGINMVAANRVIIFDASWNPSHDIQSIFRVFRFGQTKPTYIYRLLAQGTMEEKIYSRQVMKQSLSQRVVDEHQIDRHFTSTDLAELYAFKPEVLDPENRPTHMLPKDLLFAEILDGPKKDIVVSYHMHDSLLENKVGEDLTEEERKAAWEEYEAEKKGILQNPQPNMGMYGGAMSRMTQEQMMMMQQQALVPGLSQIARSLNETYPNMSSMELRQQLQAFLQMQASQGYGLDQQIENARQLELQSQQRLQHLSQQRMKQQALVQQQQRLAMMQHQQQQIRQLQLMRQQQQQAQQQQQPKSKKGDDDSVININ